jgi:hypothetical protein
LIADISGKYRSSKIMQDRVFLLRAHVMEEVVFIARQYLVEEERLKHQPTRDLCVNHFSQPGCPTPASSGYENTSPGILVCDQMQAAINDPSKPVKFFWYPKPRIIPFHRIKSK